MSTREVLPMLTKRTWPVLRRLYSLVLLIPEYATASGMDASGATARTAGSGCGFLDVALCGDKAMVRDGGVGVWMVRIIPGYCQKRLVAGKVQRRDYY